MDRPELREKIKTLHVQFEDKWDKELDELPDCSALIEQARQVAEGKFYDQILALDIPKDKPPLLSPEARRDIFNKAEERWREDGRTETWEFSTLWEYIAYYTTQAQREVDIKFYGG